MKKRVKYIGLSILLSFVMLVSGICVSFLRPKQVEAIAVVDDIAILYGLLMICGLTYTFSHALNDDGIDTFDSTEISSFDDQLDIEYNTQLYCDYLEMCADNNYTPTWADFESLYPYLSQDEQERLRDALFNEQVRNKARDLGYLDSNWLPTPDPEETPTPSDEPEATAEEIELATANPLDFDSLPSYESIKSTASTTGKLVFADANTLNRMKSSIQNLMNNSIGVEKASEGSSTEEVTVYDTTASSHFDNVNIYWGYNNFGLSNAVPSGDQYLYRVEQIYHGIKTRYVDVYNKYEGKSDIYAVYFDQTVNMKPMQTYGGNEHHDLILYHNSWGSYTHGGNAKSTNNGVTYNWYNSLGYSGSTVYDFSDTRTLSGTTYDMSYNVYINPEFSDLVKNDDALRLIKKDQIQPSSDHVTDLADDNLDLTGDSTGDGTETKPVTVTFPTNDEILSLINQLTADDTEEDDKPVIVDNFIDNYVTITSDVETSAPAESTAPQPTSDAQTDPTTAPAPQETVSPASEAPESPPPASEEPEETDEPDDIDWNRFQLPGLLTKFPFCLPADLVLCFTAFSADEVEPIFYFGLPTLSVGDYTFYSSNEKAIKIDLTKFDYVIKIFKALVLILFIAGLAIVTRRIMS